MKLGIIFKKQFHDRYGKKREFVGMEITINRVQENRINIEVIQIGTREQANYPVEVIQLIYLGGWNE